jgi:hypothetical protein
MVVKVIQWLVISLELSQVTVYNKSHCLFTSSGRCAR